MSLLRIIIGLGALLGGAGLALIALAAQGGRASAPLDVLTHFAPVYLAGALVLLVLAAAAPPGNLRRLALTANVVAVVAACALLAPEAAGRQLRSPPPVPGPRLTVVQFNALGRHTDTPRAFHWIMMQKPDVVVLQEAPGELTDLLMKRAGFHASCMSCAVAVYTKAAPLSTLPADRYTTDNAYLTSSTLADAGGDIVVVGVHRPWPTRFSRDREDSARLYSYLDTLPKGRLVMAGDFNSTPWSFKRQREDRELGMIRRTRAIFSWPAARVSHNRLPAPFPYLPIDHIYAGPGWATVSVMRGPRLGSDHYPVVVTLAPAAGDNHDK